MKWNMNFLNQHRIKTGDYGSLDTPPLERRENEIYLFDISILCRFLL